MDLDATDVFGQADRAHEYIFKSRSWESNTNAGETSNPFRAPEALMAPEDIPIPQPSEVGDMRQSSESSTSNEITAGPAHDVPDADSDIDMLRAGDVATQQDNASVESDSDVVVVQSDVTSRLSKKTNETEIWRGPVPKENVEIRLSQLSRTRHQAFEEVQNDVIEDIMREMTSRSGRKYYEVKFTDGRKETLAEDIFEAYVTGDLSALHSRRVAKTGSRAMAQSGQKRKKGSRWDDPSSESGYTSKSEASSEDAGDADSDDEPVRSRRSRREMNAAPPSPKRSRRNETRASSDEPSLASDDDDVEVSEVTPKPSNRARPQQQPISRLAPSASRRSLRPRPQRIVDDEDELATATSRDADDSFVPIVTSDVATLKGRPRKGTVRPRFRQVTLRKTVARTSSAASDIEFEEPRRRSSRANKSRASMRDDAPMDEESFYITADAGPNIPKVISVREIFQPPDSESQFATTHIRKCHSCGGSKQRGQIIGCQGCSLSYHKACIGFRSNRDHLVTKVGNDEFVLQCKFCIGLYRKKDELAPSHAMCQSCRQDGSACKPFSKRLTARQEEKLREQNDGTDPITPVSPDLINNALKVLFRCTGCHRAWHVEHLPPARSSGVATDLREERLKDYSIDWQCIECSSVRQKIDKLVAWRPTITTDLAAPNGLRFLEVTDDDKEIFVKWETKSYAHCTWMPGAWVHGIAAAVMRSSFGKHDAQQSRLSLTDATAFPEEYLMPDIILKAKVRDGTPAAKTKEQELANLDRISKIFVKFQGLSYQEVVWDVPPKPEDGERWKAFESAYHDFVEGRYFATDAPARIRDRVKSFRAEPFEEVEVQPEGLKRGTLMQYQLEGLNWLRENFHDSKSVVLADEMGLGKTIQVISLVTSLVQDEPRCWPFLVVVPNATCPNWRREFKQWAPDIRCVTYHGGREPQDLAYKYELFPDDCQDMKAHVVIMSYDSAQDPQTKTKFSSVKWAGLVVDEGQRLKNDENLLYQALRSLRVPFRLLLTGTPLQNNKRELFNLLQFIDEKRNAEKLDEEYAVLDKETLPKLHEMIRPYFLRRTKLGVLKFLPAIAQIILPVTMTVIQEKVSKGIIAKNPELIKAVLGKQKLHKKERGSLNNILMQLRKCLCHPFIYSSAIEEKHDDPEVLHRNLVEASAKLILLQVMLPKLKERGHRVLIFSQFLGQLDIIEDFLSGLGYGFRRLDGTMSSLEKQKRIDAFNAPDSELFAFLLSTRSGGVGINLATADTVIIMDPDFNPHQDLQALSRAHRIGQKKKVLCFQLVTKDSVEERIMQIGRKKMALDHALIESMDETDLGGDDLESILKHGAQALFDDDYQKEAIHYDDAAIDSLLDRSEIEETKTDEEGSADAQFSKARVWSKNKSGFEVGLSVEEEEAPEPVSSSVWDSIIAEREAEAERISELNKETLGRGGRRRKAINYKTNAALPELILADEGAESSDASDVFEGNETEEESDNNSPALSGREEQHLHEGLTEGRTSTKRRKTRERDQGAANPPYNSAPKGSLVKAQVYNTAFPAPVQQTVVPSQQGSIRWPQQFSVSTSSAQLQGRYPPGWSNQLVAGNSVYGNGVAQSLGLPSHSHPLSAVSGSGRPAGMSTNGQYAYPPGWQQPVLGSRLAVQNGQRPSEATLRLALDNLHRFPTHAHPSRGQEQEKALRDMLRASHMAEQRSSGRQ